MSRLQAENSLPPALQTYERLLEFLVPKMIRWTGFVETHTLSPPLHHFNLPMRKFPLECPGISNFYFTGGATQSEGIATERAASYAMAVAKTILMPKAKTSSKVFSMGKVIFLNLDETDLNEMLNALLLHSLY